MRVVALEEHFLVAPVVRSYFDLDKFAPQKAMLEPLSDLGEGRLKDMDAHGITTQVLSVSMPSADLLDGEPGVSFACKVNDAVAEATRRYPNRFAGFAHLPMRDPAQAADELERCIRQLGFCGAMVNGLTNGKFLDDPMFTPLLERFETLDVPLYLHPNLPPKPVFDAYYGGMPGRTGQLLASGIMGWHAETGIHVLRMALAGVFERHPKLTVMVGHMGEFLPFILHRADNILQGIGGYSEPISPKIVSRLYITTSGFFSVPPFLNALLTFGADRILFSVDYPYSKNAAGRAFLDNLPVSAEDKEKIAYKNADRVLKLKHTGY